MKNKVEKIRLQDYGTVKRGVKTHPVLLLPWALWAHSFCSHMTLVFHTWQMRFRQTLWATRKKTKIKSSNDCFGFIPSPAQRSPPDTELAPELGDAGGMKMDLSIVNIRFVLSCSAAPGPQEGHTAPGPRRSHPRLLRAFCSPCPSHAARGCGCGHAQSRSRCSSCFTSTDSHLVCPGSHRTSWALWNTVRSSRNVVQLVSILSIKCGLRTCLTHLWYSGTFWCALGPHKVWFSQESWIRFPYTLWISQASWTPSRITRHNWIKPFPWIIIWSALRFPNLVLRTVWLSS